MFRFAVYLRAFYGWLHDDDLPKTFRAALAAKKPKRVAKTPIDEEPFRALLKVAWGSNLGSRGWMRQALLWTLWDAGLRISEALALRVGSVTLTSDGAAHLEIPADAPHLKTGPRTVFVTDSVPALRAWLQHHPQQQNREPSWTLGAPLFPSDRRPGEALEPTTVNKLLRDYSRSCGLPRPVTCHVFRHARATRAAKAGWNEHQLNKYFGWAPGSRESSTYVHLQAADVEAKVREEARVDSVGARIREDPNAALATAIALALDHADRRRSSERDDGAPPPGRPPPPPPATGTPATFSYSYSYS